MPRVSKLLTVAGEVEEDSRELELDKSVLELAKPSAAAADATGSGSPTEANWPGMTPSKNRSAQLACAGGRYLCRTEAPGLERLLPVDGRTQPGIVWILRQLCRPQGGNDPLGLGLGQRPYGHQDRGFPG